MALRGLVRLVALHLILRARATLRSPLCSPPQWSRLLIWRQVRSVFFVTLIPCALSHFLCSTCALVNAAVLGKLAGLRFGVAILITRDILLASRSGDRVLSKSRVNVC